MQSGAVAVSVDGSRGEGYQITAMYRNGDVAVTSDLHGNAMVCLQNGVGESPDRHVAVCYVSARQCCCVFAFAARCHGAHFKSSTLNITINMRF